jgi:hypothetical protein
MADGALRRWFGREGNPKRARLVRRSSAFTSAALALGIAAEALGRISVALVVPALVAAFVFLVLGVREWVRAVREPHESP